MALPLEQQAVVCSLPALVPGARIMEPRRATPYWHVRVPIHGGWLVEAWLQSVGVPLHSIPDGIPEGMLRFRSRADLPKDPPKHLDVASEIKPITWEMMLPFQAELPYWVESHPYTMVEWSCGAGKTMAFVVAMLLTTRGALVINTPAKVIATVLEQIRRYTRVEPFAHRPPSERIPGDWTLAQYITACGGSGGLLRRPVIVQGQESTADTNDELLAQVNPVGVVFDEIHNLGDAKRWLTNSRQVGGDCPSCGASGGDPTFGIPPELCAPWCKGKVYEKRQTKGGDRLRRAVAVMDLSRHPTVEKRVGASGFPMDSGQPERLWAIGDILDPHGFGSHEPFAVRYNGKHRDEVTGWPKMGDPMNVPELRSRWSFFTHEVPYSESHGHLPKLRIQVHWLPARALLKHSSVTLEQALREGIGHSDGNKNDAGRWAKLAMWATRKRPAIVAHAVETLASGQRIAWFTGLKDDAEQSGHDLERAVSRWGLNARIWVAHGDTPQRVRDRIRDEWLDTPCGCIVGTGYAWGVGVDGFQYAHQLLLGMVPPSRRPGDFLQWRGRVDRQGGVGTLLSCFFAQNGPDEEEVRAITAKFGPIEEFMLAEELQGLGPKLRGTDDPDAVIAAAVQEMTARYAKKDR